MSRYIDVDALTVDYYDEFYTDDEYVIKYYSEEQIRHAPTIDIVRCKECRHWDNTDNAERCSHEYGGMWAKPDDFCSYGVKKGADDDRERL